MDSSERRNTERVWGSGWTAASRSSGSAGCQVPRELQRAREHALPALYPAAAHGLPTLTDKGYTGARIGIMIPTKGANLAIDNQARNLLITALRAPAERANALLKSSFKALRRVTLCPQRIGHIVAAALVILTMHRGRW